MPFSRGGVTFTKIVLVTTKAARKIIEDIANYLRGKYKDLKVEVITSSAAVAPLASTQLILQDLRRSIDKVRDADLIILPGLVKGSARIIENSIGVRTVKGTIYAGDLPEMIRLIVSERLEFSPDEPADNIVKFESFRRLIEVNKVINKRKPLFIVKNVKFVLRPPPINLFYELCRTSTEVCYSPRLASFGTLINALKNLGYSGVILGYGFDEQPASDTVRLMNIISNAGMLAGIDVFDLTSINKDILINSDILLNVSSKILGKISEHISSNSVLVMVPEVNDSVSKVLMSIETSISLANELGFKNVVIDPAVRPPMLGLSSSLMLINELMNRFNKPLMAGLCNVYELMDADSTGIIALLSTIFFELGVSNLLITESSRKSCGAAEEASIARLMIYEAYARKSPPKDTLHNLLILKDKRPRYRESGLIDAGIEERCSVVLVDKHVPPRMESKYLIIVPDWREQVIKVIAKDEHGKPLKVFIGRDPLSLGRVISRELKLSSEHSMYLGFELSKAHISLKLLKNFIQDKELFKDIYVSEFKRNQSKPGCRSS